jgi:hypothetical protein
MQHGTQAHPCLFTYPTEVSLLGQAPVPRVWLRWLLLAQALASTAALVLGLRC